MDKVNEQVDPDYNNSSWFVGTRTMERGFYNLIFWVSVISIGWVAVYGLVQTFG